MKDGEILIFAVIITAVVGVIIRIVLYRINKKQEAEYPKLWEEFETCLKFNAYSDLLEVGNKLVFNKYLSNNHLQIIYKTAKDLESRFPEFEELRLNAYNKQLHYNRTMPEIGSSGGIEQSWVRKK